MASIHRFNFQAGFRTYPFIASIELLLFIVISWSETYKKHTKMLVIIRSARAYDAKLMIPTI